MEAMAVGVPVVTTWVAGIPELARDGSTALTIAPSDSASMAKAIERLLEDEPLRLRMARAARKLVEQQHDLDRCGETVARLLREDPA
jgi:glycosyltransferase involved in cell wall biosynthesis